MDIDKLTKNINKTYIAKDILEQPININDAVVYTIGTKDSGLRKGVVLEIIEYDKYAEIIIDTCKRKVYDCDILVINDLLRLQGISQESLISDMKLKLTENKLIYPLYVINPVNKSDHLLFFKPKYGKDKGFTTEFITLKAQFNDCIFIPFAANYENFTYKTDKLYFQNTLPNKKYNKYNLYYKLDFSENSLYNHANRINI